MALSRVKVWISERLNSADLNAEFNNILNNANSLISPLTANVAAGGFKITGLGAGSAAGESVRYEQLGLTLIQTQTASASATIDFTGISSTYDTYKIVITNLIPATDTSGLLMRMGTGAGPSWDATAIYDVAGVGVGTSSALAGITALNGTSIGIATACGTGTGEIVNASIFVHGPSGALYKTVEAVVTQYSDSPEAIYRAETGLYKSTTAVTGFRFLMSAGNITSGIFALYGVRKT